MTNLMDVINPLFSVAILMTAISKIWRDLDLKEEDYENNCIRERMAAADENGVKPARVLKWKIVSNDPRAVLMLYLSYWALENDESYDREAFLTQCVFRYTQIITMMYLTCNSIC